MKDKNNNMNKTNTETLKHGSYYKHQDGTISLCLVNLASSRKEKYLKHLNRIGSTIIDDASIFTEIKLTPEEYIELRNEKNKIMEGIDSFYSSLTYKGD